MTVFSDSVTRRWIQAVVYLFSAGFCFYGMVYGSRIFSPPLIVALLLVVVGFMVASVWQLLLGIRASVERDQQAADAALVTTSPVAASSQTLPVCQPATPSTTLLPDEPNARLAQTTGPAQTPEENAVVMSSRQG